MNITDTSVDEWGIYRRLKLKYLDETDSWLLQKAYYWNQYPITVTVFERYPTMISHIPEHFASTKYADGMKKSGYGGIDGILLGNFANDIDFSIKIIHPKNTESYGSYENSSFTGTLGDLMYGRAQISFNSRFFLYYGTKDIRYMFPTIGDKVCVIAPTAQKPPKWKAIFKCFDKFVWFSFIFMTAFTSIIYSLVKFYREKNEMRILRESMFYKDFKNIIIEKEIQMQNASEVVCKTIFGMITKLPDGTVERFLIGSCLLFNIVIAGSLSVNLKKNVCPINVNLIIR